MELRSDDLLNKLLLTKNGESFMLQQKYFKESTIDFIINNCIFSYNLNYKYFKYDKQRIQNMKNVINNSELNDEIKQKYIKIIESPIIHNQIEINSLFPLR
jgi:hypothetical protein